jgi:Flp pilus assembly protein TadG
MKQESHMPHRPSSNNLVKRFFADQSGTIAVMTGIAAIPMVLAAGVAIDFNQFNTAQTHVQASLDAAALAAAAQKGATDAERIKTANANFATNIADGIASHFDVKGTFKIENKRVVASADLEMPTGFMQIVDIPVLNGVSTAEVNILADKKAEVVMVLDYSWSMTESVGGNTKYVVMKDAAKKLVNELAKEEPDKVQFGLVPFSHHVYTTLPSRYVLGATGATWTGCTQDRPYPANLSASTPTVAADTQWGQPWAPEHASYGCDGYKDNNLRTLDLTKNFKSVTNQLDTMYPYAYTHIALGVEFGYHMLSPNAPFTKAKPFNDEETKKFMVVLTDGAQTEPAFGKAGSRTKEDGETNLEKLCESAKADGITIITMAFDLNDPDTLDRLQGCATDPNRDYFVANDAKALATAFESVKNAITAEVYLSK